MPVFEYCVVDGAGARQSGLLSADSARDARDRLRRAACQIESLDEREPATTGGGVGWLSFASRDSARWTEAAHEMATLLAGGVHLLAALDTVAAQSTGTFRRTLLEVRDRVAAGAGFAEALQAHPATFDELSVRLVEVGENSGNLEAALDRLATFKLRWSGLRDQVTNALVYPLFVLSFGTLATLFLMTYVMPPLLDNLKETLDQLPWPTVVVKFGSDLLLEHGWMVGLCALLLVVTAVSVLRSGFGRTALHRLALRLPLFGPLTVKQNLSRASLILSTLLESGLPLATALDLAAKSLKNVVLRRGLEQCREALTAGQDLAGALAATRVIPPLAVQIFAVGQESGRLEELLARLADDYDRQVQTAAGRLTSVMEPVMILILAGMIGFVLLAIVLPILEASHVAM